LALTRRGVRELYANVRDREQTRRRDRLCRDCDAELSAPAGCRSRAGSGIAVMSDKPATATYDQALKLEAAVSKAGLPYGLTHTYAGYSLVAMRDRSVRRAFGPIRKVAVEYLQGWLSQPLETTGQKQAAWRSDPALNGPGGCIGDIGTHAFHLVEYVTDSSDQHQCGAAHGVRGASWTTTARAAAAGRRRERNADGVAGGRRA